MEQPIVNDRRCPASDSDNLYCASNHTSLWVVTHGRRHGTCGVKDFQDPARQAKTEQDRSQWGESVGCASPVPAQAPSARLSVRRPCADREATMPCNSTGTARHGPHGCDSDFPSAPPLGQYNLVAKRQILSGRCRYNLAEYLTDDAFYFCSEPRLREPKCVHPAGITGDL
jgi:hypothetical protein